MDKKIFGIGLAKTGTNSLALALKQLGYNKIIHYINDIDKFWTNVIYSGNI